MGKLDGKNVLITGGVTGIGKATLDLFLEEGVNKIVLADFNEELGQKIQEEHPEKILFVKTDVASEEEVNHLYEEINTNLDSLDILFNNAGIGKTVPSHELSFEQWRKIISINLDGLFLVAQRAIQIMLEQENGGVIINTASGFGWVGGPGKAPYTASKGAVVNLTRTLGLEYAEKNIRVNALCPGYIETPILGAYQHDALIDLTPMNRLGTPEEMAKASLFLASDDSSFMTAASLIVDGGYTAQ